MEGITHILTGILIQLLCFIYFMFPFNFLLTLILAFFSHFLIDTLAKITYHTPDPHPEDKFWVIWHIITPALILILLIWVLIINWTLFFFFLLGVIAANFVDIWDWMLLRPKHNKLKKKNPEAKFWGENLYIHPIIDWIREHFIGFLPNLNENKKGVLFEITIILILWVSVWYFLGIFLLSYTF
ncbi:MAG: hypothetical protein ACTSR8_16220 [Promethearchaeota archaeon]